MRIKQEWKHFGITEDVLWELDGAGLIKVLRYQDEEWNVSKEENEIIKKSSVLIKCGMELREIKEVLEGKHSLQEAIHNVLQELEEKQAFYDGAIALGKQLLVEKVEMETLDADKYLAHISAMEKANKKFFSFRLGRRELIRGLIMAAIVAGVATVLIH